MFRGKLCLFLALLFCFAGVRGTLAAEKMKMVSIPERGVSIAVPESYITFERSDLKLDSRLSALGLSENEWRETMQTNGIYLYVFTPDLQKNINVVVNDSNGLDSIGYLTDDFLSAFMDVIKEQFESVGAKVEKSDIKRDKDVIYIRSWLDGTQITGSYSLQYLTVIDSQTIVFTLAKYNKRITSEDEELLDQIVKSSLLRKNDKSTSVSKPIEDDMPNANYYHDTTVGLSFMIPNGWEQKPLSQERKIIKMKMSPVDDSSASIMFGWEDFWSEIPEASRKEWGLSSRRDMDSWATAEMFAAMFGLDEKDLEMKQYAGMNFGIGWLSQDTSYGIKVSMLCAVTFKNGYGITFQIMDMDKAYGDMLYKVLDSIYLD